MGMSHSAYHFYGAHVPQDQWKEDHPWAEGERLDPIIGNLCVGDEWFSLGHITAGDYDHNMLFLCIRTKGLSARIDLGEFRLSQPLEARFTWDSALTLLAVAADYDTTELAMGWITVPDLS